MSTAPDPAAVQACLANPESIDSGWKARLLRGKHGGVLGNVANALTALRSAPVWRGVLHFNESTLSVVAKAAPPFEHAPATPLRWADEDDVLTAEWLQHQGIPVNREIAGQAVQTVAREHCYHPIRDYLDSLKGARYGVRSGPGGGPIQVAGRPDLSQLSDEELQQLRTITGKTLPPR